MVFVAIAGETERQRRPSPAAASVRTPAPYYVTPGTAKGKRRLLLISPAFPPCAEVGALRWQKIAEFAADRGWVLDVITGAAAPADRMDDSRLLSLPAQTRVWTIPLRPVLSWRLQRRALEMLRALLRRPPALGANLPLTEEETRAGRTGSRESYLSALVREQRARSVFATWDRWCEEVSDLARSIARDHPPDLVVSSGPPHMAHEAARRTATILRRPLAIDLRDPWFVDHAEPEDLAGRTWRTRTEKFEAGSCRQAALVVVNTKACATMMAERYPEIGAKLLTVMNGADAEVRHSAGRSDDFVIAHAGNLYGGRDPRVLFRGIRRFLDSVGEAPNRIRVAFLGGQNYEGVTLTEIAQEERIDHVFVSRPTLPRADALRFIGKAAVLVVLPQAWSYSVPAKVFEYMQFNAALLVLCEPRDAAAQLLEGSVAHLVAPDDPIAIAQVLSQRYQEWLRGERAEAVNADGRFDRPRQAQLLMEALERLV